MCSSDLSKSQGEVHYETLEDVVQFLKLLLMALVNDRVMPMLAAQGYKTEGKSFLFDEVKDLKFLWEVAKGLLEKYDIPTPWIYETFGVPVIEKKAAADTDPKKKA